MNLCDELTIRMLLERHGFHFSKSMGQNFLTAAWVPEDIAAASSADRQTGVLEIGPGIGTMTQYLACAAKKVIAVEIDKALIPILEDTLSEYENVRVINHDVPVSYTHLTLPTIA